MRILCAADSRNPSWCIPLSWLPRLMPPGTLEPSKPKLLLERWMLAPQSCTRFIGLAFGHLLIKGGVLNTTKENAETRAEEESKTIIEDAKGYSPINKHLGEYAISVVNITNRPDLEYNPEGPTMKVTISEILEVLKGIFALNPPLQDQILTFSIQTGGNAFQDADNLADFAAAVSSGEPLELQSVLEAEDGEKRSCKNHFTSSRRKSRPRSCSRKPPPMGIKKELGMESDGKGKLVMKFKERAAMLEAIQKVFEEEIIKLPNLKPAASEFNVTRNYLDWLTQAPWATHRKESFDLQHATKDVKNRILELIAVGKLRGTVEGKIIWTTRITAARMWELCPEKYFRLKKVQSENPLFKSISLVADTKETPPPPFWNCLTRIKTTPSLNNMDVPIGLSKVCSCPKNSLDTIRAITLSDYIAEEKVAIPWLCRSGSF
ncbi:hypothetical protein BC830DRAFT_1076536 [Chytriomyces sp. MP71]|nr:hypothetical protein BC830DRAFT_1076536 [Chytriomyces sp. MP71]